ncbi:MAG TPA: ankyrin repeat domain-containing protein [Vicinamibacterales bacterium]|jgi:ankyrin repeat protein|nr:ankyrin repeat domain-containing protein [Vicinamibacterales bacterium]
MRSTYLRSIAVVAALLAVQPAAPAVAGQKGGGEPTVANPDGTTALHWAVRAGDAAAVKRLLRAGAKVNAANRYGVTPLALAAMNGDAAMITALVDAGADVNAERGEGETVLMTAARTGRGDAVRVLLARGARVDATERTVGQTALMWAASENHADAVRVLVEAGADVNKRSAALNFPPFKWGVNGMVSTVLPKGSWTPLMYAARQNAVEAARALVAGGADVNATDPDGATPLLIALANAHYDMADALLDLKADPNLADVSGQGPLYAAVEMHTLAPMVGRPSPKLFGQLEAPAIVTKLLELGANPNAGLKRPALGRHHDLSGDASMGEGTTPLMRAARTGDVELMRILMAHGANPHQRRRDLGTALTMAATGRGGGLPTGPSTIPGASNLEAIRMLLKAGVDPNGFNLNGQTALHIAAQRGADPLVLELMAAGARLDLRDKQKRTPLDLALGTGLKARTPDEEVPVRESTAALLKEAMAKP